MLIQNDANNPVSQDIDLSGGDIQVILDLSNNGLSRSGTPTNGDIVLNLPDASTCEGKKVEVIVRRRSNAASALAFFHPQSGQKIAGGGAAYNQSYLQTNAGAGASVVLCSDGVDNWNTVSHF